MLVVSNEEDDTRALMGEIMMAYLKYTKKIAGIVLDGPIRDIDEIGNWDFPVYCTGTTPGGPYKEGPGEINVPIGLRRRERQPRRHHPGRPGRRHRHSPEGAPPSSWRTPRSSRLPMRRSWPPAKNGTANRAWVEKSLAEKGYEIIDDVYHA